MTRHSKVFAALGLPPNTEFVTWDDKEYFPVIINLEQRTAKALVTSEYIFRGSNFEDIFASLQPKRTVFLAWNITSIEVREELPKFAAFCEKQYVWYSTNTNHCFGCIVKGILDVCDACSRTFTVVPRERRDGRLYNAYSLTVEPHFCNECDAIKNKRCYNCVRSPDPNNMKLCAVCLNNPRHEYNFKPAPRFLSVPDPRRVLTKDIEQFELYLGIELEVEKKYKSTKDWKQLCVEFLNRTNQKEQLVYAKWDRSCPEGFEIVSHPASLGWWQKPDNPIIHGIAQSTGRLESWSRPGCGMHVHVSRFPLRAYSRQYAEFVMGNPLLCSWVGERIVRNQAMPDVTLIGTAERHVACNLNNNNTIEVRIFKGNMRRDRILKNLEFTHSVGMYVQTKQTTCAAYLDFVKDRKAQYPNLDKWLDGFRRIYG